RRNGRKIFASREEIKVFATCTAVAAANRRFADVVTNSPRVVKKPRKLIVCQRCLVRFVPNLEPGSISEDGLQGVRHGSGTRYERAKVALRSEEIGVGP